MCYVVYPGEITLLLQSTRRTAMVRAVTHTEMSVLGRTDLLGVLSNWPRSEVRVLMLLKERVACFADVAAQEAGDEIARYSTERVREIGSAGRWELSQQLLGLQHGTEATKAGVERCPRFGDALLQAACAHGVSASHLHFLYRYLAIYRTHTGEQSCPDPPAASEVARTAGLHFGRSP